MKTLLMSLSAFGLGVSMSAAQPTGGSAYLGSSRCNIVQLRPGESPPLATPTGRLPNAREKKASGPAGAIPIPSQADGSRAVTDANGGCTIYRYTAR
jgi:hypothetical protein